MTIGFTLFFGTQNLPAQTLMTGMLSILVFSGLPIIVVIVHPFAGSVRVRQEALAAVLDDSPLRRSLDLGSAGAELARSD